MREHRKYAKGIYTTYMCDAIDAMAATAAVFAYASAQCSVYSIYISCVLPSYDAAIAAAAILLRTKIFLECNDVLLFLLLLCVCVYMRIDRKALRKIESKSKREREIVNK